MSVLLPEVQPLRIASREVVRELGFLQPVYAPAGMPHSQTHALVELERAGGTTQRALAAALRLDKSTTSRLVRELARRGWVQAAADASDGRARSLSLTPAGRRQVALVHHQANERVQRALALLSPAERRLVVDGMAAYARALAAARARDAYALRRIRAGDAPAVARLIRTVMPEFGASGPGFAIHDAEVDDMVRAYRAPRSAYFVVVRKSDGEVVGGGGVAPLAGGDARTCELRKMYFLPEVRGLGFGQALLERCLDQARRFRFARCYLETLRAMERARALYEKNGFRRLRGPRGNTGHFSCDAYYERALTAPAARARS